MMGSAASRCAYRAFFDLSEVRLNGYRFKFWMKGGESIDIG